MKVSEMRISVTIKTKNGGEKSFTRKINVDNAYYVFNDIQDIITHDISYMRVVLYDNCAMTLFALSSKVNNNIDWIGLSYIVDNIQKNINLEV